MKILLIGSGGREHALAWGLARSQKLSKLYVAPGNAGTAQLGENIPIGTENLSDLVQFARREQIDLTVVGPEAPSSLASAICSRESI
jgi:phosphoribosylamine--glycine ligase